MVITGKRFKDTAAGNTVRFGQVTATNISVPQKNKIIAQVPSGAVTGLVSVTTSKGTGFSDKNFVVGTQAKWTFMVYVDGDNNLEPAALDDFLEMAAVASSPELNIVVQMDRIPGYSSGYGNWTGTRRFLVENGDTPSTTPLADLGEQNMGDPAVLQDFVEWAITDYPAEHYALSIWNHGGGWRVMQERLMEGAKAARLRGEPDVGVARAIAWDDTDNDKLYMREVQDALLAAKTRVEERSNTVVKLDIVGFDACLMGMVEVAYSLRDVANYVVGSEHTEPFNGWPYDTILQDLTASPTMSASDLASVIVTKYYQSYSGSSRITQAAVHTAKIDPLATTITTFTTKATSEWDKLKDARNNSLTYHPGTNSYWGVDMWDFSDEVSSRVTSPAIKLAAGQVKNAINDLVVHELHSADMDGSHGVAIYFPATKAVFDNDPDHTGYEQSNTFMPVDFVRTHRWDEWLQEFYTNAP